MTTKFFDTLGSGMADRWLSAMMTPAAGFWGAGFAMWMLSAGWDDSGLRLAHWFQDRTSVEQGAVIFAAVAGLTISAAAVEPLKLALLRILEGYWPRPLAAVGRLLIALRRRQLATDERRWQELQAASTPTAQQEAEKVKLELRMRRFPSDPGQVMPTKIGNTIRAGERLPYERYGLDAVICWPRLWLLLPDGTRSQVTSARAALDSAVIFWAWGALVLAWSPVSLWALPLAAAAVVASSRWTRSRAEVFADVVESTFDVHRFSLYEALRFKVPDNPANEPSVGQQVTAYLWRGSRSAKPFVHPLKS